MCKSQKNHEFEYNRNTVKRRDSDCMNNLIPDFSFEYVFSKTKSVLKTPLQAAVLEDDVNFFL